MKPKTVMLLAVAVGCGLLAMLGVQQAMSGGQVEQEETVSVLVALEDIEIGEQFSETNVGFREFPISALPEDPVTSEEQYTNRSPNVSVKTDDIIRVSKLSEEGVWGKSIQIPKGMRVVSIPVDETHSLSGLLQPGDRIDLNVTYTSRATNGRQVTKNLTLLEYVEVFSTDDKTANEAEAHRKDGRTSVRHVALLLTPEHTNLVKLAQAKGQLAFAWRHKEDDVVVQTKAASDELINELRGSQGSFLGGGGEPSYATMGNPPLFDVQNDPEFGAPPKSDNQDEEQNPPAEEGPKDFGSFLANMDSTSTTTQATEPEPETETWNMQIYVGNDAQIQEFEISTEDDNLLKEDLTAALEETLELSDEDAELLNSIHVDDAVAEETLESGSAIWKLLKKAL